MLPDRFRNHFNYSTKTVQGTAQFLSRPTQLVSRTGCARGSSVRPICCDAKKCVAWEFISDEPGQLFHPIIAP
eukprot:g63283.t1